MIRQNSYWVTVGSRGFSKDNLLKLISYAPDGIRINTGRNSYEWSIETIDFLVKNSFPESKIFLDIGNNKSRVILKEKKEYTLNVNNSFTISRNDAQASCFVNSALFFKILEIGDAVLFGDGEIKCKIEDISKDIVLLRALNKGTFDSMTAINIEGKDINHFYIEPKECSIVKSLLSKYKIGLILSFVENVNDIIWAEENFIEAHKIIPKIETLSSINNIDNILEHSKLILLGRGDLALAVGIEKIGFIQKIILEKAKKNKTDIIIGSGMLESLLSNNTPHRSEIIDITNSFISGAAGIMLTSETGASETPFIVIDFLIKTLNYLVSVYKVTDLNIAPYPSN
jgi:pyruvate kinase